MCLTQSWAGIFCDIRRETYSTLHVYHTSAKSTCTVEKRHQQNLIQITLNIRFFLFIILTASLLLKM